MQQRRKNFTKLQIPINFGNIYLIYLQGRKTLFEQKWSSASVAPTTSWKRAYIERDNINWNSGVIKFNIKPEEGIRYLLDEHMIENSPEAVARFLREDTRINKLLIGGYLASKYYFPSAILTHQPNCNESIHENV